MCFPNCLASKIIRSEPLGFLVVGFLKGRVYKRHVTIAVHLKTSIVRHVILTPADMLCAATENAVVRFQHIVDRQGMHIE